MAECSGPLSVPLRFSSPGRKLTPPPSSPSVDAGFNKGWEDKGNGQNDENAAEAAHKESAGDHPREWQFVYVLPPLVMLPACLLPLPSS